MTELKEIDPQDIREGDKIRVDLTAVASTRMDLVEYTARGEWDLWSRDGNARHYLLERPVELRTGMIVKSSVNAKDFWVRTGEDAWAAFYLGLNSPFHLKSSVTDSQIRGWLADGTATAVVE